MRCRGVRHPNAAKKVLVQCHAVHCHAVQCMVLFAFLGKYLRLTCYGMNYLRSWEVLAVHAVLCSRARCLVCFCTATHACRDLCVCCTLVSMYRLDRLHPVRYHVWFTPGMCLNLYLPPDAASSAAGDVLADELRLRCLGCSNVSDGTPCYTAVLCRRG